MQVYPKVSIVIPTFNRADLIDRTIESVLNQTYENFEVLIVDDASTDNTYEVISSISDERIRYIQLEKNTKGTMTRNVGIENSSGEYVAFLDSDDEWVPTKLEEQIQFISNFNKSEFLCFTGLILNNGNEKVYLNQRQLKENEDILDYILVYGNKVQTSTFLLPTKIAKEVKFNSDLKKHQDWDFCLRLKKQGIQFFYLNKRLTIWNVDPREDRISINNKYNYSINWYKNSKMFLSIRAQHAFLVKCVANYYILNNQKLSAMRIFLKAHRVGAINNKLLMKCLLKLVFPYKMWKGLKSTYKNIHNKIAR